MEHQSLARRVAAHALHVAIGDHLDGLTIEEAPIFGLRLGKAFVSVSESNGGILLGRTGSPLRVPVIGPAGEEHIDAAARSAIDYLFWAHSAQS